MPLPIRGRYAPAAALLAALALPLAAAGTAQASVTRPVGPLLPTGPVVQATMTLNVIPGSTVTVNGTDSPGNCTADETDTTVTATTPQISVPFGYTAVDSGSCVFQQSWADFVVTISNSKGTVEATRTVELQGTTPPYRLFCDVPFSDTYNLNCRVINDQNIELSQTGGEGPAGTAR
jgi:hypothetical protein